MFKKLLLLLCLIYFLSSPLYAETFKTNIEGVVVKNVQCKGLTKDISATVVNRTENRIEKKLRLTVFDSENDPVKSKYENIDEGPISGNTYRWILMECDKYKKYLFRFED